MVSNFKIMALAFIVLFLHSCKKEKIVISEKYTHHTVKQNLYDKIYSFIDSSNCKEDKVIAIRYQRFEKKEFIQISAQSVFITDSLFMLKEHQDHIISFYNKDFFEKILEYDNNENRNLIKKNIKWDLYKSHYSETGIPCFKMYELVDQKLVEVPQNSYYYYNLFVTPPMSEPAMPPSK